MKDYTDDYSSNIFGGILDEMEREPVFSVDDKVFIVKDEHHNENHFSMETGDQILDFDYRECGFEADKMLNDKYYIKDSSIYSLENNSLYHEFKKVRDVDNYYIIYHFDEDKQLLMYRIEDDIGEKELVIYSLESKKNLFVEMIYFTDEQCENFSNDGKYFIKCDCCYSNFIIKVYELNLNENGDYKYSLKCEKYIPSRSYQVVTSISFTKDNQYMILAGEKFEYISVFSLNDFEEVEDTKIYEFYTDNSLSESVANDNGLCMVFSDQLFYSINYEEKCIVWMPHHNYSLSVKNIKYDENDKDNNKIKSLKNLAKEQNFQALTKEQSESEEENES